DAFSGSLNGGDFEISGLTINRPDQDGVGLFGVVGSGASISALGLVNVDVVGQNLVGGLAGINSGDISGVHISGEVSGDDNLGALVGQNLEGTIASSYSTASASGVNNVGGLVGWNEGGSIENTYATGSVVGSVNNAGGLVGYNDGTVGNDAQIISSYASGSVG